MSYSTPIADTHIPGKLSLKKRGIDWRMWTYRGLLFLLLFGVSSLTYGCDQLNPMVAIVGNLAGLAASIGLFIGYLSYPAPYKWVAWILTLAIFGLVLESLHEYKQYVYSFFVIKRLAYCGLALLTLLVARGANPKGAKPIPFSWIMIIIGVLMFVAQVVMGKIFQYSMTSDTRPTSAYDTLYLVLPLLFFLMRYRQNHRYVDLLGTLFVFAVIVILLHRSVISTALFAVVIIFMLAFMGRLSGGRFPFSRTVSTFFVLALAVIPFMSALSPAKMDAFLENIGGITKPTEDNTGNWRLEQSLFYWSRIPDRPWLGWRYEGYDRGEVMANEDFPSKGTIIHSQYIDMLYNYGIAGLLLNLFIIGSTLWIIFWRNKKMTLEQTVLFAFIASGLLFGVSYQLPIFYWGFVGLGLYYANVKGTSSRKNNSTDATSTLSIPTPLSPRLTL